jgi:hypothetical protein
MILQSELPKSAPQPGAALVLERWNSWARIYFPDTGEWTWVNLAEVGFSAVEDPVEHI